MADSEKEGRARRPLTYDDRVAIEHGLNRGDRIAWIARSIGRTQHMVAEEVKRNWTDDPRGHLTVQNRNICVKYATCEVRRLCKTMCMAPCRKCRDWLCNSLCPTSSARRARSWSIRPSAATRAISGRATDAPTCTASTRPSTPRIWRMPAEARPEAA